MKTKILFMFVLIYCSYTFGQVSKVGTTAAPFLQIGVGSRAAALGEAYTSVTDEASSLYWNPASIDFFANNEVQFNYSDWLADMKFLNAIAVLHIDSYGSFGLSVTSLSTPEMVVRTVDYPEGIGSRFDAADIAMGLSYSKKLTDRFAFGATFKYINRRIWNMNANAIAMDFGIIYKLPLDNMQLGMSILNFGSKLQIQGSDAMVYTDIAEDVIGNNTQILSQLMTKEWALPLSLRFGLSYKVIESEQHHLLLASDYIHPNDNFSSLNFGGEYGFLNHFFVRAGYKSLMLDNAEDGLTFGGGIKYAFFGIDYSYVKMKHLKYVQQFSIKISF
ncbi:MAG: hypothetical protein C4539_11035 [Ignavibacteriales bacterium]|nr:MAG: hypothetical protein C4539_11035 [Ignavibacteriales bacterium]